MIDLADPKFQWGQPVVAATDLYNDGSYPDVAADDILVRQGDKGEVVQIGTHVEANVFVYLVEFHQDRVVGCLESEIVAP